jgi:hypothetical protein
MKRNKLLIPLFAFMLCMGALFFAAPAYASDGSESETLTAEGADIENLTVDGVWLEGEMLKIEVTDKQTGINQTLEVPLTDYAGNSEYVSVQAVDNNGNKSNTIHFKNPFYTPETETAPADPSATPSETQSGVPDGSKPLTPDGTGTVTDNVTDGDGKEFFTITTEDGNVFYMIIDRQRETDNVYLLGTVTEDDLAALAEKNDGSTGGVPSRQTPTPDPNRPPATSTTPAPEPEPTEPPSEKSGGMNSGTIIFIAIAAAVVGIVGYYFKIVRPKKNAAGGGDEYEDEGDYDDEDYGNPGEDGEDE